MSPEDLVLSRLILKRKWASPDQILQCLRSDEEVEPHPDLPPLAVRLIRHQILTDSQLGELMPEVRRLAPFAVVPPPPRLGEILTERGLVLRAQVDEALSEQARLSAEGKALRLGEILVAKGYVRPEDILSALREQGKRVLRCTGCGLTYNVQEDRRHGAYACESCGAALEPAGTGVHVDDGGARIRTIRLDELPEEVRDLTRRPMVQFGRYIIVKEILRGDFGALLQAWQKDTRKYVGIVFLDAQHKAAVSETFAKVQRALADSEPALLEVGEYEGRKFLVLTLEAPAGR